MQKQIEQLYSPLYMYIRKRIGNQLDAEDLTQEVFYKLAKSNYDEVESIKNWVYTIAKNTITDYYRKKKHVTEEVDNITVEEKNSENDRVQEFASCCIIPFVNKLPKDYRLIMTLSELDGISQKEIAKRLEMNYATVRSKIQRGRLKLKNLISDCCTLIQGKKGSILDFKKNRGGDGDC